MTATNNSINKTLPTNTDVDIQQSRVSLTLHVHWSASIKAVCHILGRYASYRWTFFWKFL